jgi:hypothetical protein
LTDSSFKQTPDSAVLEGYIGMTNEVFTSAQVCCILFAVVWPIYLCSHTYKLYMRYGAEAAQHFSEDSGSTTTTPAIPGLFQTPQSARAQEILLGCAAYFDEAQMLDMLQTEWVEALSLTIFAHALAISVVQLSDPDFPITYANRSFEARRGSSDAAAAGQRSKSMTSGRQEGRKKARLT